jgi:uncharacterized OB-fold protein
MSQTPEPSLTAKHSLEYSYKRSLGPVLSQFFTALRDRRFLGVRRPDGSVMVPPKEYDPDTSQAIDELVEVADEGVVRSTGMRVKARWADETAGSILDFVFVPV